MQTLNTDLNIIQALDDLPNATGGLSAAELKEKFDEGVNIIKDYINNTLIPALNSQTANASGAKEIGIEPVVDLSAQNVMDAITELMDKFRSGAIDSVTSDMLTALCVVTAAIDNAAVTTPKLADGAVTGAKTNFSSGLTIGGSTHYVKITEDGRVFIPGNNYTYGTDFPTNPTHLKQGRLFFKKVENS